MLECKSVTLTVDKVALSKLGARVAVDMINAAGKILEKEVKLMLSVPGTFGSRTGKVYDRGRRNHTASAKTGGRSSAGGGEPPAIDTGRLRDSILTQAYEGGKVVKIGPSAAVNYAADLEEGIPDELVPRPYLRPVIDPYIGNDNLARRAATHVSKLGGRV